MGHVQGVLDDEEEPKHSYYLLHHAILKPDSITTKLRVVFDASCATNTGVSLNDTLIVRSAVHYHLLSTPTIRDYR